jgi:hypothetical protein
MLMVPRTGPEGRAPGSLSVQRPSSCPLARRARALRGSRMAARAGASAIGPLLPNAHPANLAPRLMPQAASGALGGSDPNAAAFSGPVQRPAPWCKCKCSTWRRWPILEVTVDIPTPSALRLQCRANPKTTTRQTSKPSWVGTIRPECAHFDKKSDKLASQDLQLCDVVMSG